MSEHRAVKSEVTYLKTDQLSVDRTVQRAKNQRRVDELVAEFNVDALGILTVSVRDDGTYHIVDGQHRWAASSQVGLPVLECQVYKGLSKQDEASLFRVRNNTKIVSPIDRFLVRVVEGDLAAVFINDTLKRNGWHIATNYKGNAGFSAVAAIEWVYNGAGIRPNTRQQAAVREVFEVITAAWGYDPDGVRAELVKGLGLFLVRFGHEVDLAKVVNMLAKFEGGPLKLSSDSKLIRNMQHCAAADSVAQILTNLYNKKRTVNRLPDWFTSGKRLNVHTGEPE